MVEDRIRDGRRIAELLASELTGLETGPLADVDVVDSATDVTPSPEGARAYDVSVSGERVASVSITERTARVEFVDSPSLTTPSAVDVDVVEELDDLSFEPGDEGSILVVESGAAVKRAVDVVEAVLG